MAAKTQVHDGSDYQHRQRILPHYQIMALCKKRLKFTLIMHLLIAFLMAAKLTSTVLDMLNIFWQPLEELYIPMAKPWEWVWFSSLLFIWLGFRSIKSNNSLQLKIYLLSIVINCVCPLLYCAYLYINDLRTYVITRDAKATSEVWQNYPVCIFWFMFIGVACQVHVFELYFGYELLRSMSNHRTQPSKNK